MSHLSPSQLRAARGLLNWSRADVSRHTGVSEQTLHRIENGITEPEVRTLNKITKVLEKTGVELIGDRGVALRNDSVRTLSGEQVFLHVLDDVIDALQGHKNPEAFFACVRDAVSPPDVIDKYNKLRGLGIKMRSLIRSNDRCLMGKLNEYRGIPEKFFHNNTIVIYADKVATMILDPMTGKDTGAVIIQNPHIAAAQRNLFDLIWTNSKAPLKSTASVRYDDVTT